MVTPVTRKAVVDLRRPIDVEQLLVWAYRDQKAHLVIGRGEGLEESERALDGVASRRSSACGVAAVERIGLLGTRVDGGGPSADHLHRDAEAVHRAVWALPWALDRMTVIECARMGEAPDWMPEARPVFEPVVNGRGQPRVTYLDPHRNYGMCEIEWTVTVDRIARARSIYSTWWRALDVVAGELRGRLEDWIVTGPSRAAEPWKKSAA